MLRVTQLKLGFEPRSLRLHSCTISTSCQDAYFRAQDLKANNSTVLLVLETAFGYKQRLGNRQELAPRDAKHLKKMGKFSHQAGCC